MTTETTSREAPLATSHRWFLDLYAALLADPSAASAEVQQRFAAADATDAIESALALYLAALLAQQTGDPAALRTPRALALRTLVAEALEREMAPAVNAPVDTWVIALWAAALRETNHLDRSEAVTRLVGRVKNHVYANHVRMGALMASSDKSTLDFDVLLAAVPFGLFDCEDLVLVDSIRTLTAPERLSVASPADRMLLAWYYAEQGSYAKSRKIVAETDAPAFAPIVTTRLKAIGQLNARFIRHAPEGNGNRYEPLLEERFPKLITDTDIVLIRAQAAPLSADEPLELVTGDDIIPGTFTGDCWEFRLTPQPAGTQVHYQIRFQHHSDISTQTFAYEVLTRHHGGTLRIDGSRFEIIPGDQPLEIPFGPATLRDISWLQSADGTVREISAAIDSAPCGYFGFGERYNALDQSGNRVDQFVYNQYKEQGLRTYIPMPVAYTDAGFGLHIATDSYSWFDLPTPGTMRLGIEADRLTLDLFTGSIAEQVSQFMAHTGDPEPVPAWALGPWMSSNNWDNEAEVRKQVALTLEHQIPATVLVIEAWSDEATFYIFNDAQYAEKPGAEAFTYADFTFPEWGRWPDPKGMAAHLHDNDLRLILWQIPIIKQSPALKHAQKRRDEAHFFEHDFGVRHPDGKPLRLPEGWFKDSLLMDFTSDAGRNWWFDKRQYLIDDLGVDGFKTDGGEMVWGKDLVFADGTTGLTNRNAYPRDYISAYYRFAQQNGGICFSRAGYTGAQTFPAHWAGDERSTWDAFKRSILAGLSAGMSGVIFWGWDLGGFSGEVPSAELYVRSAQMACFCPIMQYHAESKAEFNQDRTPWNIADRSGDSRALTGYAFYANLRMSLMPYLTREAAHCVAAKTPLMRAMIVDHQHDAEAAPLWDQYMFGRDLLVAPIIHDGERSREVYLPQGRWWHLLQNRWLEGSQWHRVDAPFEQIPVFLRENAILPLAFDATAQLGATMPSSIDTPRQQLFLVTGTAELHHGGLTITAANGKVSVTGQPDRDTTLVFADQPLSVTVNGVSATLGTHDLAGTPLPAVTF